ncbi:MAG: hypothetical protein RBU37_22260 [Myxococcota bacterium]|nr:hypothetical protein [Myxococcota bacterium]
MLACYGEEYSIGSTSLDRFYSLFDDGALFAFASLSAMVPADSNTFNDIYLFEPDSGRFELVSASANGEASDSDSFQARLSADGRVLAFVSKAKNLVSTDSSDGPALFVAQLAGQ